MTNERYEDWREELGEMLFFEKLPESECILQIAFLYNVPISDIERQIEIQFE